MCYANAMGGKLLHLAIIQHAAMGKPHIIPHPFHLPAGSIAYMLGLGKVETAWHDA